MDCQSTVLCLWGTNFDVGPRGVGEVDVLELYVPLDGVRLETVV